MLKCFLLTDNLSASLKGFQDVKDILFNALSNLLYRFGLVGTNPNFNKDYFAQSQFQVTHLKVDLHPFAID